MKCTIGDIDVYYKCVGKGFPVLMIHGYSLDHRVMTGCMEPVFARKPGFQRVYFDLPGMGRTAAGSSIRNSQDMLELVLEFIKQVIPDKPFAVVGESFGGYLARGVVGKMMEQAAGMLLICPVVDFLRAKRKVPKLRVLTRDQNLLNDLGMLDAEEFQSCVVIQTAQVWERFNQEVMAGIRLADFSLLERVRDTEFDFDPEEKADQFKKPVAILLARHDNSVGYLDGIELFKKYPAASVLVADNAGHNLQIEQEALFTALVHDWVDRLSCDT